MNFFYLLMHFLVIFLDYGRIYRFIESLTNISERNKDLNKSIMMKIKMMNCFYGKVDQ